jgi:hypothetical protein
MNKVLLIIDPESNNIGLYDIDTPCDAAKGFAPDDELCVEFASCVGMASQEQG